MKCTRCGTDNKLKDRTSTGGKCTHCRHAFVFDPKAGTGVDFTDGFFINTIQKLSVNDTLFFTHKQLCYFFNNRKQPSMSPVKVAGCLLLVIGIIMLIAAAASGFLFLVPAGLLFLILGLLGLIPSIRKKIEPKRAKTMLFQPQVIEGWVERWTRVNGPVQKLLPKALPPARSAQISPEIKSYSFDRLVVCERAEVAHFLISNNFHFEHNCAVLSFDKYPQDIFDTVMEMLGRNPELKVYALHNASPTGVQLTHWLRNDPAWFRDNPNVTIYDLGLMPRQAFDRKLFVERSDGSARLALQGLPAAVRATLLPEEIKWLEEGNFVDLQSFAPAALLRIITAGIAKSRDPNATNALADTGSDSYYGGPYIFMYDNFG